MNKPKIDPELKQKWVKALRSGDYKQGMGILQNDNNQFCCLGVLCDVVGFEKRISNKVYNYTFNKDKGTGSMSTIPPRVIKGLTRTISDRLVELNDRKCMDFNEIANWIDENL